MSNLIANRYEVIRHIGQGGMADVFVAVDTILNREVAVKMMRGELSKDTVSVLRFEREAQAATTLSHPNIVEIYDVGEYKGHHYIVMEYVPGKTLKAMIRDRGALYKEEAVDIMKQLVSATAEAHRRGIIHRDIKPQNVIVKADGTVKVLDFGIAMLTQGNMQLTQSNSVMGSVHYLAPELARGESASAQSDIYALGIVLYEMLTGEVPFKADSAVQVALMHMRNEMPSVRDFNPAIPQSVENIVIRATAKNKGLRYRSCNEMLEDLRTCLRPERANEPKLILPTVSEQAAQTHSASPKSAIRKSVRRAETAGERSPAASVHAAVETPAPKKNRTMLHLLIVLLVALAAAGIYFALSLTGVFKPASKQVAVPDLVGLTITDAKDVCTDNHLVLDTSNVQYTLTEDVEKGKIISSDPAAGSEIDRGSRISVTVSSGIGATVSDYTGKNINDAINDLAQYKNMKVDTVEEASDTVSPGVVIRQELLSPGTQFNPAAASEIRLVYASYPTIVIPADIEGKAIDEAVSELEALGAKCLTSNLDTTSLSDEEIANLKTGIVIKSDPEIGSEYTQKEDNYVILYYY